jgi:hypothetical protein
MILSKLKLYALGAVALIVGFLATYNRYLQRRRKELEKELEVEQSVRKIERKVAKESGELEVKQQERRVLVTKKKRTRSQGLGAGRRES